MMGKHLCCTTENSFEIQFENKPDDSFTLIMTMLFSNNLFGNDVATKIAGSLFKIFVLEEQYEELYPAEMK